MGHRYGFEAQRVLDELIHRHIPELDERVANDRAQARAYLEAEAITTDDLPIFTTYGGLVDAVLCPYLDDLAHDSSADRALRFRALLSDWDRATDGLVGDC